MAMTVSKSASPQVETVRLPVNVLVNLNQTSWLTPAAQGTAGPSLVASALVKAVMPRVMTRALAQLSLAGGAAEARNAAAAATTMPNAHTEGPSAQCREPNAECKDRMMIESLLVSTRKGQNT